MGKKSRLKRERQGLPRPLRAPRRTLPPVSARDPRASALEQLVDDYLEARGALDAGAERALFRGQPVDYETLAKRYFAVGELQGFDRMELLVELTVAMN